MIYKCKTSQFTAMRIEEAKVWEFAKALENQMSFFLIKSINTRRIAAQIIL